MSRAKEFRDVGFLTDLTRQVFLAARWFAPIQWASLALRDLRPRSELTDAEIFSPVFAKRRAWLIDLYVSAWILTELAAVSLSAFGLLADWAGVLMVALATLRIVEIVQVTVNVTLFDALNGRSDEVIGSRARMVVLAGINYVELLLCFGLLYSINIQLVEGAGQPVVGLYLSAMTQFTIGYGDVHPTGWLRAVAALQGFVATLFIILVFGRLIASFRPMTDLADVGRVRDGDSAGPDPTA